VTKFKQNVPIDYNNNIERLVWFNHDEISQQFLRALPNHDSMMLNNVIREAVRNYLILPSLIPEGFADGNYFIERNKGVVDPYGISVKNAMLLRGDYIRMHGMIQTMIMDMLKSQIMGSKGAQAHVPRPCPNGISPLVLRGTTDDEGFHHS